MKKLILFLLLIPFVSAQCIQTTSGAIANSTTTIDYDGCINLTDLGIIIQVENIKQNQIHNMTPYSTRTNAYTNESYYCQYPDLNINQTLDYEERYDNNDYNIHLVCEQFPFIDEILNLTAGNTHPYTAYNLTVNSLYKQYNIDNTLTHEGTYENENNNITIKAPPLPIKNDIIEIDECDYYMKYHDLNITITSPDCINKEITLGNGESYEVEFFELIINAPKPLSEKVSLIDGEEWTWKDTNLSVSCNTPFEKYDNFCKNKSAEFISTTWKYINITNMSCNTYGVFCVDKLTESCTYDERIGDKYGLIKCVNRVVGTNENLTEKYRIEKDQCIEEKDILVDANDTLNKNEEELDSTILMVVGGLCLMVGIVGGMYHFIVRKSVLEKKKE